MRAVGALTPPRSTTTGWARWRSPLLLGLSVLGIVVVVTIFSFGGPGFDFYAYWAVDPADPYRITDDFGAFRYPPPLIWLAGPLRLLPFVPAYVVWTVVMAVLLVWLAGRWSLAWLAFPPVTSELYHGNIHLLMAAVLVAGFRFAPAWVFLPFAKLTTGVVLVWPLIRREYRRLGLSLAVLLAITAVSFALTPDLWTAWVHHVLERNTQPNRWGAEIGIPLLVRLPVAVVIAVWGAWTNRRWAMAPAVVLALPVLWVHGLSILAAIPALRAASSSPAGRMLEEGPD